MSGPTFSLAAWLLAAPVPPKLPPLPGDGPSPPAAEQGAGAGADPGGPRADGAPPGESPRASPAARPPTAGPPPRSPDPGPSGAPPADPTAIDPSPDRAPTRPMAPVPPREAPAAGALPVEGEGGIAGGAREASGASTSPGRAAAPEPRLTMLTPEELEADRLLAMPAPASALADPGRPPGDHDARHDGEPTVAVRTALVLPPTKPLTTRGPRARPIRSAAFVLGYRQFSMEDRLGRAQSWHMGSIEVTPLRRYVRLNLVTEVGVEGGEAARGGDRADFMLLEKLGLGAQYPHWVTPLVEFQAGIGLARVELFERNDLVLVYTLGLDAGAQWALARWIRLHATVGWLRPTLRGPDLRVVADRVTFKVGVGF